MGHMKKFKYLNSQHIKQGFLKIMVQCIMHIETVKFQLAALKFTAQIVVYSELKISCFIVVVQ